MRRSASDYAAYLLTRRLQSQRELEEKLARKKYDPEEIASVITRFKEVGLIDDQRFAKSYVADKLEFARRGRWRISLELRKKGISKELIDEFVGSIEPEEELRVARELLKGRQRAWANLDPQKRYVRAVGLLSRRGFSGNIIRQVLAKD
ncbi:MAG TPA: regulatory protein RecX [Candidatus Saccharimonadales bacterium]|nr:regulatory protein RecX [Candidatus Saccharimonadales bacterium]